MISLQSVSYSYRGNEAVRNVSASLPEGELVAVVGANGSGKSTLLKLMARVLTPLSGSIIYGGRDLTKWNRRAYAREVGYLPQDLDAILSLRAVDVVLSGRAAFLGRFEWESPGDRLIAERALDLCDVSSLAGRSLEQMSGGERKRIFLARVLAGQPRLILLDEPFAALDLAHIQQLFSVLLTLSREQGCSIVFVSHDLNWSSAFADRMLVMHKGELVRAGKPAEVMQSHVMRDYFHFDGQALQDSSGRQWIVPRVPPS